MTVSFSDMGQESTFKRLLLFFFNFIRIDIKSDQYGKAQAERQKYQKVIKLHLTLRAHLWPKEN